MSIRGKVLLIVILASSLLLSMGLLMRWGTARGRAIREVALRAQAQHSLINQLRGDSLEHFSLLQRARASGRDTSALLSELLRQVEARFTRLRALAREEATLAGQEQPEEERLLGQAEQSLSSWLEHAEASLRGQPTAGDAQIQGLIEEFGLRVEPPLKEVLKRKRQQLDGLLTTSERSLDLGRHAALLLPLVSMGLLLMVAASILVPMSRRLRELLAQTERIGRGEQARALPESWRDEFGTLAHGFNQMTQQLQATQARLMVADRLATMGRTAAGVGHEINNPISYVLANLSYLLEELKRPREGLSAKEQQELLEAAAEAWEGAERVRFIAQDLKMLSRAEETTGSPVQLSAVVRSSVRMAAHELRGRARVVEDCADVPPVQGNAARLGQVFLNLIINAAHALAPGRAEENEIRVTARLGEPGRVTVDVSDTGSGIAPELLERIFEPFFTTKPEGEGTGLGLAVCRSVVTSMGGDITVESQMGRGTTFRITLPAFSSADARVPAPSAP
jgi:two-component system, NtrC family, sensor kinase